MYTQKLLNIISVGASRLIQIVCIVLLASCVDIEGPTLEASSSDDILSEFRLSTRAVMMQVDDIVPLTGVAVAVDGSPMDIDVNKIRWRSLDSSQVYIDTSGNLISRGESDKAVRVIAAYTHGVTTKYDTISVYVTTTRVEASSVRIVVLDSNRVGANPMLGSPRVRVDLYDEGNNISLQGAQIPISVRYPLSLSCSDGYELDGEYVCTLNNTKGYLGPFWISVSVNLYGKEVKDSSLFHGVYPARGVDIVISTGDDGKIVELEMGSDDPIPHLQPCGIVTVIAAAPDVPLDIVFSDSSSGYGECGELADTLIGLFYFGIPAIVGHNVTGNNLLALPYGSISVRRSNSIGKIHYYARHSITKERLPISGWFNQLSSD